MRRHQRGLSLLECTLAVLVVAVLTLMAFERIAAVRADMERAQVRHTVAAMRSALALRYAELAVTSRLQRAAQLDGANALALLAPPPFAYRGARESARDAAVPPGSWYYAAEPGLVVYRPRDPRAFGPLGGRLYWRVRAGRDTEPGYDRAGGIVLAPTTVDGQPLIHHNVHE